MRLFRLRGAGVAMAATVLGSLVASPRVMATDVNPGYDLFVSGAGSSHDFADTPIPADFFYPGSDPFTDLC